ncbi:MAG: hypothetical protein RLZZ522_198 [Verrucomicrobiota bacterium]
MNLTPDPADVARLTALGNQAEHYATHMMRTTGSVPPTVIADTAAGYVFCMPAGLPDVAAKDRFAETARLLAVAHAATALVMVVEAWVRLAKPGTPLDTETPPSQAPDRQEMVVLMLEDATRCGNRLLPIHRGPAGEFLEFGHHPMPDYASAEGRFAGLMPKVAPTPAEVASAKATLLKLGMCVVNRGFDPEAN